MKHTPARPVCERIRDGRNRDVYFCQQAVFALFRTGASSDHMRAARRDLAEARAHRRWRR